MMGNLMEGSDWDGYGKSGNEEAPGSGCSSFCLGVEHFEMIAGHFRIFVEDMWIEAFGEEEFRS